MSTSQRTRSRPEPQPPRPRCLLCPRRPSYLGIWIPHKPPAGHRLVTYTLCRKHFRRREKIASEIDAMLTRQCVERN
jgi:hypothetical protein